MFSQISDDWTLSDYTPEQVWTNARRVCVAKLSPFRTVLITYVLYRDCTFQERLEGLTVNLYLEIDKDIFRR